jgi:hypothetical protein
MVELDPESGEVALMRLAHFRDQILFAPPFGLRTNRNGGSVGVVSTDVKTTISHQLLKPDPDVGLEILDEVAEMDVSVCVRKRRGNKDFSHGRESRG